MYPPKEYEYIVEIAKCGNITKAANNLYISQPALSRFLANLEQQLNVGLFERIQNRYVPTPAGEIYLKLAGDSLSLFFSAIAELHSAGGNLSGNLSVGIPTGRGRVFLPVVLPSFKKLYPNIDIQLTNGHEQYLETMLSSGNLHAAYLTIDDGTTERYMSYFDIETVSMEEIVLFTPKKVVLKSERRAGFRFPWTDLTQLSGALFLVLNTPSRLRLISDKILQKANLNPKMIVIDYVDTAIDLILHDFGVALISRTNYGDISERGNLYSVGDVPTMRRFVAAYRKNSTVSEPLKSLTDMIKTTVTDREHEGNGKRNAAAASV